MFKRYTLPGRRLRPARDPLAEGHRGAGRGARPVPPLHRHRPDDPRLLRRRDARRRRRAKQTPLPGVSMRYSFDAADAPTRKETQYYEMLGTRGIWHKGWKAVTEHGPVPSGMGEFDKDRWQLFHTDEDRVGGARPRRRSIRRRSRSSRRSGSRRPRSTTCCRSTTSRSSSSCRARVSSIPVPPSGQYIYYPGTSEVPERSAANVHGVSFKVLAEVEFTPDSQGVIFAAGLALRRLLAVREGRQARRTPTTSSASRPSSGSSAPTRRRRASTSSAWSSRRSGWASTASRTAR